MNKKRKVLVGFLVLESMKRRRTDIWLLGNAIQNYFVLSSALATCTFFTKNIHVRISDFYEKWISCYLESDFFGHFRMGRKTFNLLLNQVGQERQAENFNGSGSGRVPLEKGLLMTVWYLAKGESLNSISDRFGVAPSTCHDHINENVKALSKLAKKFVKWPRKSECQHIVNQFMAISAYPNVIGAIDGCHVNCKVPEKQQESYSNRKMGHSIILQGICTPFKLFTNICIGFPGSVHDARRSCSRLVDTGWKDYVTDLVLKECTLYEKLQHYGKDKYFYEDQYHLVGDSAYPCLDWLMTPYRDTGRLTRAQKIHNTTLSKARVVIENTYALLKGRWRILKYVDVYSTEKVINVISACCMLHNFCLLNHDIYEERDCAIERNENEPYVGIVPNTGTTKRDSICRSL